MAENVTKIEDPLWDNTAGDGFKYRLGMEDLPYHELIFQPSSPTHCYMFGRQTTLGFLTGYGPIPIQPDSQSSAIIKYDVATKSFVAAAVLELPDSSPNGYPPPYNTEQADVRFYAQTKAPNADRIFYYRTGSWSFIIDEAKTYFRNNAYIQEVNGATLALGARSSTPFEEGKGDSSVWGWPIGFSSAVMAASSTGRYVALVLGQSFTSPSGINDGAPYILWDTQTGDTKFGSLFEFLTTDDEGLPNNFNICFDDLDRLWIPFFSSSSPGERDEDFRVLVLQAGPGASLDLVDRYAVSSDDWETRGFHFNPVTRRMIFWGDHYNTDDEALTFVGLNVDDGTIASPEAAIVGKFGSPNLLLLGAWSSGKFTDEGDGTLDVIDPNTATFEAHPWDNFTTDPNEQSVQSSFYVATGAIWTRMSPLPSFNPMEIWIWNLSTCDGTPGADHCGALTVESCINHLTECWRLTRADGVIFRFTSLDVDLEFNGETYIACRSLDPTASQSSAVLGQVGNQEATGVIDSDKITERDLYAQLFDDVYIEVYEVDYVTLEGDLKRAGWGGNMEHDGQTFKMEVLGPTSRLQQTAITKPLSPFCDWDFLGAPNCGFDVEGHKSTGAVLSATNRGNFQAEIGQLSGDFVTFTNGKVRWTLGQNIGVVSEVKDVVFDSASGDAAAISLWKLPPFVPAAGDTFDLLPGCDLTAPTCKLYGRFSQFGGFLDLPGNNKLAETPDASQ